MTERFGERWVVDFVTERLDRGLNAIVIVLGPSGTGKSWSCLRLAELIDPLFSPSHIVFSIEQLLSLLNTDGAIHPGEVVVWDESGLGAAARNAMTKAGKVFSFVLESVRYRGFALFVNVPNSAQLDVQAPRMAHLTLETVKTTLDHLVKVKPFIVKNDPRKDMTYYAYPVIWPKGGMPKKMKRITIEAPSKPLSSEYESKRDTFIRGQYALFEKELLEPGKGKTAHASRIIARNEQARTMHNSGKSLEEISTALGVSERSVHNLLQAAPVPPSMSSIYEGKRGRHPVDCECSVHRRIRERQTTSGT